MNVQEGRLTILILHSIYLNANLKFETLSNLHKNCTYQFSQMVRYRHTRNTVSTLHLNRFACVTPKYISGKDKTDFVTITGLDDVWMISKCKPEARYLDQKIIDKCLHPMSNDTLSSLIPVTDGVLHYRSVL